MIAYLRARPRLRFWLLCLATFVAVQSLTRLTLIAWGLSSAPGFGAETLRALALGLVNDAAMGVLLGAPFLAGMYLVPGLLRRPVGKAAGHLVFFALLALLVFNLVAETIFWNEFDSRYNSIAVNYLIFPREVVGNIRQSFDLGLLLPPILAAAAALYWPLRRRLSAALAAPLAGGERLRALGAGLAAVALTVPALAIESSQHFANRELDEIAANGLHSLFRAALTNDQRYDGLYLAMPEGEALPIVRALVAQDNTRPLAPAGPEAGLWRRVSGSGSPKRLNVVLVIEESFGSTYVDSLDNTRGEAISPRLDRLAREGLLFTNVHATGNRTVRGLEAILTSFPPIPGVATVRRAGADGMNSLPTALKRLGYETAFLYGGRAVFDNMGWFWSHIGFDHVWDQGDIAEDGFTTAWGVADEYLFGEALRRLDQHAGAGRPFFLGLLTVSNHRPYLYPDGRIDKPAARRRKENAATYADWAFGDFIERARGHAWFKDTVFVFIGDHGPRVYGAAIVPVPSYRVPLLFYSPAHLPARRIGVLGSSLDVAPTLLGLLGVDYDSPFFGVDLMRVPEGGGRVVMEHNYAIAYAEGGKVAALVPGLEARGYLMEPGPRELRPAPGVDRETLTKAIALAQTAHHMFYAGAYHRWAAPAAGPTPGS
ncbi:MAG: LTA synthase family protein [Proteobacteria bacterium]|nr:LTA synthase family protein [Pseudomonadota bacterium]